MNETLELMMKRKSVRVFEEKPIGPEEKQAILNAAMRAPTAGNSMLYSILDVTDQAIKDKLSETCDHQPFIAKAPMVWVFLADYRRWVRKFQQAGCENIPNPRLSDLILATNDTVIAAHAACMAAESLGIGSCYIGYIIEQWEEHQKMFQLPQFVAPVSMLVFGYPTQQQKNRPQTSRFPPEDDRHGERLSRPDGRGTPRILPRWTRRGLSITESISPASPWRWSGPRRRS